MGVFAIVGIGICGLAMLKRNAWMGVLGLLVFGIGVAGDMNGYWSAMIRWLIYGTAGITCTGSFIASCLGVQPAGWVVGIAAYAILTGVRFTLPRA